MDNPFSTTRILLSILFLAAVLAGCSGFGDVSPPAEVTGPIPELTVTQPKVQPVSAPIPSPSGPPVLFTGERLEVDSKLVLKWNPAESAFDYIDAVKGFRAAYPAVRSHLLTQILDQSTTEFTACSSEEPLRKGDMAFLALNRMEDIPWASLFEMQFCVLEMNCPYPTGLIPFVAQNRDFVKMKLERKAFELDL